MREGKIRLKTISIPVFRLSTSLYKFSVSRKEKHKNLMRSSAFLKMTVYEIMDGMGQRNGILISDQLL